MKGLERIATGVQRAIDRSAAGLGLLLGAIAGVLAAFLFLWAFHATAVVAAGAPWERRWLLAIHSGWGAAAKGAAALVSVLGTPYVIAPLAAAALAWWTWRGTPHRAARLLAVTAALTAVDFPAKAWFGRARPALFPHVQAAGASYPSGHALFAVGFYGPLLTLALAEASRGARAAGLAAWAVVAAALGVSRLVLGVHWPTDVAAGWAAGAIVWAAVWLADAASPAPPPAPPPAGG